ncbi:MAG: type I-G CRISPR-associated protein Csb2 [Methylococcaceae bacterium]
MAVVAFEIEFLGPVFLSDPTHPGRAEWPPSPARVYAALIAAVCEHELGAAVLAAVRTLEQTPPAITASDAHYYAPHSVMVPVSYSPSYPFDRSQYRPQSTCEISPVSPHVVYHWPIPDSVMRDLTPAVEHLTAVGRGESLVIGRVLEPGSVPPPNWIPDPGGWLPIRVPGIGRFDTLERDFQAGRATVELDLCHPYRHLEAQCDDAHFKPRWDELLVLRLNAMADIRSAALLTDALRLAVLSVLGDNAHPQIHGHAGRHHVAWSALPDVGHPHADGHLTGVGVWLPCELESEANQQLRLALTTVREISYRGRRLPVEIPRQALVALKRSTWARPAKIWASATPVVFDHRISREEEADTIMAKTIRRAGYPLPLRVNVHSVPALKGGAHAGETRCRRSTNPRRHAIVEFDKPIHGPLLVGAERYFGLGFFKPIDL